MSKKTRKVAARRNLQKRQRGWNNEARREREAQHQELLRKAAIDAESCRILLDAGLEKAQARWDHAFDAAKASAMGMGIPISYLTMSTLGIGAPMKNPNESMSDNVNIMRSMARGGVTWNVDRVLRWGLNWAVDNLSPMEVLRLVRAFPRKDMAREL